MEWREIRDCMKMKYIRKKNLCMKKFVSSYLLLRPRTKDRLLDCRFHINRNLVAMDGVAANSRTLSGMCVC